MSRSVPLTLHSASVVLALVSLSLNSALAQVARIEVHPFASMTLTEQQILTGAKDGRPVTLAGELRIPRPGTDRLPAVILLHGSGGISGSVDSWSQQLNSLGVATFVPDSFTARGITSTVADQDQLARLGTTIDAYRALELLARHPRIDPARIAVMGFSRGGQAALYSSLKRLYRMHGPAGGVQFAAYVTLYANCGTTYMDDVDVADKPIRMFHGSADDYVPVVPCRAYVDRLRAKGKDVSLTEYADAHHVFDSPALKTPVKVPQAQTTRRCRLEESPDGRIINSQTRQPFTNAGDACVEKGVTIAYNADAHAQVLSAVKEFVSATLKPK